MMFTSTQVASYQVRNRDRELESSVAPRRLRTHEGAKEANRVGVAALLHRMGRATDRPAAAAGITSVGHTPAR
ncbi:hypothetical protein [Aquihabitans sp. McL0605]|uniref:hypothetical protein n=1 Tax=Aquihabitans sp. McL0605 TaxID=3415671 RepID=UPI003CE8E25B